MDNYFPNCPARMDDGGRPFTDFRSPQVREELFKQKNGLITENEARTFRIENAEDIADEDWKRFSTTYACPPKKKLLSCRTNNHGDN